MTTATDTRTIGMVGNLTADPELHFSAKGTAYATSRISVRPYVAGAEVQPDAEFFDLVCFGGLAENVAEVLRKGSRVVVSGRLETDTWTGRDGVERESQKVIADAIGPELRFTTVTVNRTQRTEPAPAKAESTLGGLLPPATASPYSEEPF